MTELMLATRDGNIEFVKHLLTQGAFIDMQDERKVIY